MTPPRRTARQRAVTWLLTAVVAAPVGYVWVTQAPDLMDRRPSIVAPFTADELRERPDITEVVPEHAEAAHAVREALSQVADVTWRGGDIQSFTHQRDGKDPQVVDGYPAMWWAPDAWLSEQSTALDEQSVEKLAQVFRDTLEPRGYQVSTRNKSTRQNVHRVTFSASNEHGSSLQLFDDYRDEELRLIVKTYVHLYRSDTCDPDPLTCFPTVDDLEASR